MKFNCPYCNISLECEDGYNGLVIDCPKCENRITIPQSQPVINENNQLGNINERMLKDPKEKIAFILLLGFSLMIYLLLAFLIISSFGTVLLFIILALIFRRISELFAFAIIKTNAVEVSKSQFSDIYNIAESFANRLGKPLPKIYIVQDNFWNAFAMKIAGKRVIMLLSGAIDSILQTGSKKQLAFVVGHELGHHFAGHLNWGRRLTASLGSWCIWVYLWYKRRCELTCDRYGLACAGNLEDSLRAMCNMAVGSQLAREMNIEEAIAQWNRHRSEFFVKYSTLYASHPNPLWRIEELRKFSQSAGIY